MITTVFDKTQVWPRKSILSVVIITNSDPYETILEVNQKNVQFQESIL